MARGPIIFNLKTGQAYRAEDPSPATELARKASNSITKRRVVKTVTGLPPHVVQPQTQPPK